MLARSAHAADPAATHEARSLAPRHSTAAPRAAPAPLALGALSALAAAIMFAGCGADRPAGSTESAVQDSTGIRVVESRGPGVWPAGGGWTAAEAVSIGVLDGPEEYTFGWIRDLAVLADGRVAVLDGMDMVVKLFDASGRYVRRFGGKGGGPAEFEAASGLALRGDTILVHDWRLHKLAAFSADGELLRTRRVEWRDLGRGLPTRFETIPGGLVVVLSSGCQVPPPEDRRPRWMLLTWSEDGSAADTILSEANRGVLAIYGEHMCSTFSSPDGRRQRFAVRPDGTAAHGDGASYEIRIFRLSAAPAEQDTAEHGAANTRATPTLLRRDVTGPELTADALAAYRERVMRPSDPPRPRERERIAAIEAALDSMSWPRYRAAFATLHWDDRGHLWVRRVVERGADTVPWDVFDPELTYLGAVPLPAGLTVRAIAGNMIWGTVRDDLGVQYVKGYRLTR